jgi:sortase A
MSKISTRQIGGLLIFGAFLILVLQFWPVFQQEIRYVISDHANVPTVLGRDEVTEENKELVKSHDALIPVNEDFGIVIPKIGANEMVHKDIDWKDGNIYQRALQTGVAHAKGTSTPDKSGNVFLFSHSGIDFYEATRYNAVFYLLGKLDQEDEIFVFYEGKKYVYRVTEKKLVNPEEVDYLTAETPKQQLTLMTCWPAGTTFQRLIVLAEPVI